MTAKVTSQKLEGTRRPCDELASTGLRLILFVQILSSVRMDGIKATQ
jgi:hypothetical protein